eukprot:EG_transcript_7475
MPPGRGGHFGVTPPASVQPPSAADRRRTAALLSYVDAELVGDVAAWAARRDAALAEVQRLAQGWLEGYSRGGGRGEVAESAGAVALQGSVQLGADVAGDDLDLVLVAAEHVSRADFFRLFPEVLRAHPAVTDLRTFREAAVPLIQFTLSGVAVDLKFCRVERRTVDPRTFDATKGKHLSLVEDDKCMRSLSGTLIGASLLRCIPDVDHFRVLLRVVKAWAKRRGVYGKVFGYFGGLAWSILAARVCQLYPTALPATLVEMFFKVWSVWPFPSPVLLTDIVDLQHGFVVWQPSRAKGQVAPVITPCYPAENCALSISLATLRIIRFEARRAWALCRAWPTAADPVDTPAVVDSSEPGPTEHRPEAAEAVAEAALSEGPSEALLPSQAVEEPPAAIPPAAPLPDPQAANDSEVVAAEPSATAQPHPLQECCSAVLEDLLAPLDLANLRPYYLCPSVVGASEPGFLRWRGFVQSRLSALLRLLEADPALDPRLVPRCTTAPPAAEGPAGWTASWLIGLNTAAVDVPGLTERWVQGVLLASDFPRPADVAGPDLRVLVAADLPSDAAVPHRLALPSGG